MKNFLILLLSLLPLIASAQQVNGNSITPGTVTPSKLAPQPAGTTLCNLTGNSASPTACASLPPGTLPVQTDANITVSGSSYTLTYAPTGPVLLVYLDGLLQPSSVYSVIGTTLTFSGLLMSNYLTLTVVYSHA